MAKVDKLVDPPFNVTESLEKFPKILDYSKLHGGLKCVAFEKHDGTNLAFKWRRVAGFIEVPSFRSGRTIMEELGTFGDATEVFDSSIRERADETMRPYLEAGREGAVLFCEFRGARSFSGEHVKGDPKTLHPIDLWVEGLGFMPPEQFAGAFRVEPVYRGKLTTKFAEDVRAGRYPVNEGVVCKGGDWGSIWTCKIKTRAWLAKGGEA